MKHLSPLIVSAVLLLGACGCKTLTSFGRLPDKPEFARPATELRRDFPDLVKYDDNERMGWWVTKYDLPAAASLVQAWGEPQQTRVDLYWSASTAFVEPFSTWTWTFGDKQVTAVIDRPPGFGWRPHVRTLRLGDAPAK